MSGTGPLSARQRPGGPAATTSTLIAALKLLLAVLAALAGSAGAVAQPRPSPSAADPLLRFFPPPAAASRATLVPIPPLPTLPATRVSPEDHNQGVARNNLGLAAMDRNQVETAIAHFRDATWLDPNEPAFWHNLGLALKRSDRNASAALDVFRRLMVLRPQDPIPPYSAGLVWLNQLERPAAAVPYLQRALTLDPNQHRMAVHLAEAYQKCGLIDEAITALRTHAHLIEDDPYPLYLLGTILAERDEIADAVRTLTSAAQLDREGYVWDALIRTRFQGGMLDGLAELCRAALARWPKLTNRSTIEHLGAVLSPQRYRLNEFVSLQLTMPEAIKEVTVTVRLLPTVEGQQRADLAAVTATDARGLEVRLPHERLPDGRLRITLPRELFLPKVELRVEHDVAVEPWFSHRSRFATPVPDLDPLRADPRLNLQHPLLLRLAERLRRSGGDYLQAAYLAIGRGFDYRENFADHDVAWALANPDQCDCTEFSVTLAALCLLEGIPARTVSGFLVKRDLIGKRTEIGHAWNQVFVRGRGWIPVDPTLGRTMRWAYFGNQLADQILFDATPGPPRPRVTIHYQAKDQRVQIKIDSAILVERR